MHYQVLYMTLIKHFLWGSNLYLKVFTLKFNVMDPTCAVKHGKEI